MKSGFTLIETLVYIALFVIIIGGVMLTVYQVIQGSGAMQAKTTLQEEGNFILAKLNWALTGAVADSSVTIPAPLPVLPPLMKVVKPGLALIFDEDSVLKNIRLETNGSGNKWELNSDRVAVSNLFFSQTAAGQIKANFTLTALSNQGYSFSQDFEMTKYLR